MNRYLTIPLGLSFLLFAGAYLSHGSFGQSKQSSSSSDSTLPSAGSIQQSKSRGFEDEPKKSEASPLLSFQQARTLVLDGWPTVGSYHWGSRGTPRVSSYAELADAMRPSRERELLAEKEFNGDSNELDEFESDDLAASGSGRGSAGNASCILTSIVIINGEANPTQKAGVSFAPGPAKASVLDQHSTFPLHVDRRTKEIKIFANETWQPYDKWRDENLPVFLKSLKTGRTAKR